jgi:hypothetical protein
MEKLGPVLVIGGVIALVGGIVYLAWLMEKKRTEAMTAWAQANAFVFEGAAPQLVQELSHFKLFSQGGGRVVKNLMRGGRDVGALRVCDYQYTTGSGKNATTHHQTICIVNTPGRAAPHFFVRRQLRFFDAMGKMFGGQDINFDDDKAFSDAFVLQTNGQEQQLRHFMTPRVREGLVRLKDQNPLVEVNGDVLVFHFGKRLKPEQLEGLVAEAVNLRRLWS